MQLSQEKFSLSRKGVLALIGLSKLDDGNGIKDRDFFNALEDSRCWEYNPLWKELDTLALVEDFQYTAPAEDQSAAIAELLKKCQDLAAVNIAHDAEHTAHTKKTLAKAKRLAKAKKPATARQANEILSALWNFNYTLPCPNLRAIAEPFTEKRYRLTPAGKDLINGLTITIKVK